MSYTAAAPSTQMYSRNANNEFRISEAILRRCNSIFTRTQPLMSIRRTASASLWPEDDLQHFWQSQPCCGGREKSALLHFSGFHLCRVGVTASNVLKAFVICPPLGNFQMSEHQAINMALILRKGRKLGCKHINKPLSPKVCDRCNPLFPSAVKSVSSASLAILGTVSAYNWLISKSFYSSADPRTATDHTHSHMQWIGDMADIKDISCSKIMKV